MKTKLLVGFDTTGSMSPCIAEVRRRIDEAFPKLFGSIENLEIGIISFGDYCDIPNELHSIEFTDRIEDLKRFVNNAPNTSGGDGPEFYEHILHVAQSFSWEDADNKLFLLIGDNVPHPVGYRYGGITYHVDWKEEARKLSDLGVSIYPVQALGNSHCEFFWNELAKYGNGKKVNLNQFTESVETIIAVSYHKTSPEKLEEYKQELVTNNLMNRSLMYLFDNLQGVVSDPVKYSVYTKADASGLIPVPPTRFQKLHVDYGIDIMSFVKNQGINFKKGRGFYQFTKSEMIQEHKEVILENKVTGDMFTGAEARNFIGLPFGTRGQIRPKMFDDYRVYVQSTSSNRKLVGGTLFLYENEHGMI
jgi:hypothetical protein